jgi:hypothetical protein
MAAPRRPRRGLLRPRRGWATVQGGRRAPAAQRRPRAAGVRAAGGDGERSSRSGRSGAAIGQRARLGALRRPLERARCPPARALLGPSGARSDAPTPPHLAALGLALLERALQRRQQGLLLAQPLRQHRRHLVALVHRGQPALHGGPGVAGELAGDGVGQLLGVLHGGVGLARAALAHGGEQVAQLLVRVRVRGHRAQHPPAGAVVRQPDMAVLRERRRPRGLGAAGAPGEPHGAGMPRGGRRDARSAVWRSGGSVRWPPRAALDAGGSQRGRRFGSRGRGALNRRSLRVLASCACNRAARAAAPSRRFPPSRALRSARGAGWAQRRAQCARAAFPPGDRESAQVVAQVAAPRGRSGWNVRQPPSEQHCIDSQHFAIRSGLRLPTSHFPALLKLDRMQETLWTFGHRNTDGA